MTEIVIKDEFKQPTIDPINKGNRTVIASGTTLFHLAAKYLGDATQWIRIAQENNLSDPMIRGVVTLKIPQKNPTAGGGIPAQ